eukprot:353508-Chlamydomonas_euryale.AAC.1
MCGRHGAWGASVAVWHASMSAKRWRGDAGNRGGGGELKGATVTEGASATREGERWGMEVEGRGQLLSGEVGKPCPPLPLRSLQACAWPWCAAPESGYGSFGRGLLHRRRPRR